MLIDCVECGNKISDKSSKCTKCGCPTTSSIDALKKKCEECGNHISADDKVCSECGAPCSAEANSESVSVKDLEEYDSLRDTADMRRIASRGFKETFKAVALTEDNIADVVVRSEVCPYCKEDFILKYDDFESTNHPCPHCSKTINIVEERKQHKIRKEKRAAETEQEERDAVISNKNGGSPMEKYGPGQTRKCPHCGSIISMNYLTCRYCGKSSEVSKSEHIAARIQTALVIIFLLCIVSFFIL